MKLVAPCKNCPDRTPSCHGSCDKYKEWVKSRELSIQQKCDKLIEAYTAHNMSVARARRRKS